MSGERQWTLTGAMGFRVGCIANGSGLLRDEMVRVVEASRLSAVEAERDALRTERDAYREGLAWYRAAAEDMARDGVATPSEFEIAEEAATHADSVLARFPKNETEQG